jgi:hypothetical protein
MDNLNLLTPKVLTQILKALSSLKPQLEAHSKELTLPTHSLCLLISKIMELEGKQGVPMAK